jgi:hypothetical protein
MTRTFHSPSTAAPQFDASRDADVRRHPSQFGRSAGLSKEAEAADCITITIGRPDGRCLSRVVPRVSWEEPASRTSLLRDMGLLLA